MCFKLLHIHEPAILKHKEYTLNTVHGRVSKHRQTDVHFLLNTFPKFAHVTSYSGSCYQSPASDLKLNSFV